MSHSSDQIISKQPANQDISWRRCVSSRTRYPREQLLRFVVSPDNELVFDVYGKLPGRGAWLFPNKHNWRHSVNKSLWHRTFKQPKLTLAPDLEVIIDQQLQAYCKNSISLLRRSGQCHAVQAKMPKQLLSELANTGDKAQNEINSAGSLLFPWLLLASNCGRDTRSFAAKFSPAVKLQCPGLDARWLGAIFGRISTPSVLIAAGASGQRLRLLLNCLILWRSEV